MWAPKGRRIAALTAIAIAMTGAFTGLTAAHAEVATTPHHEHGPTTTVPVTVPRPPAADFTLTPVSGGYGTVAARGQGCLVDGRPGRAEVAIGDGPEPWYGGRTDADGNGDWTVSLPFTAPMPAGRYPIVAWCDDLATPASDGFAYRTAYYSLSVSGAVKAKPRYTG